MGDSGEERASSPRPPVPLRLLAAHAEKPGLLASLGQGLSRLLGRPEKEPESIVDPERLAAWAGRADDEARAEPEVLALLAHLDFSPAAEARCPPLLDSLEREPDAERRRALLDRLGELLAGAGTRARERARQRALAVARAVRQAEEADPATLGELRRQVEAWLHHTQALEARERRRILETTLSRLAELRRRHGAGWPLDAESGARFQEEARSAARAYLAERWLHGPWLTGEHLSSLLASELAPLAAPPASRFSEPLAVLGLVWTEVASGRFDPGDCARRLRAQEEHGLWVHSLVYTLLELAAEPAPDRAAPEPFPAPPWSSRGAGWLREETAAELLAAELQLRELERSWGLHPDFEHLWRELRGELEAAAAAGEAEPAAVLSDRLGAALPRARGRAEARARRALRHALARCRVDPSEEAARAVAGAVAAWLESSRPADALARRGELEALLGSALGERRAYAGEWPPEDAAAEVFLAAAGARASDLIDRASLQCPWTAAFFLADLLAAELGHRAGRFKRPGFEELRRIWAEVASGHFDAEDCRRRLLALEEEGLGVHSLVFSLLDLAERPPPAEPAAETFPDSPWERVETWLEADSAPGAEGGAEPLPPELYPLLRSLGFHPRAEAAWAELRRRLEAGEPAAALLERLERALPTGRTRLQERERKAILRQVGRLRGELESAPERPLAPAELINLRTAVECWLQQVSDPPAAERRERLQGLLAASAAERRLRSADWPLPLAEAEAFRRGVRQRASLYAGSEWMCAPALTCRLLADLLAAELAVEAGAVPAAAFAALRDSWMEVAAGRFDRAATRRRLRRLEAEHSVAPPDLAYTLLALPAASPALLPEPAAWDLERPDWPGEADAGKILLSNAELCSLLESQGFSPDTERLWPGLWQRLKALIEVEIPDFPALRTSLLETRKSLRAAETEAEREDPMTLARRERSRDELLVAVLEAGDDEPAALAALARDPVDRLLPFVEQIPFLREGEVSWRIPVEIGLLHKRPRDREAFLAVLEEVEALLPEPQTRRRQKAWDELKEALARLRRSLERRRVYVPSPLKAFEAKMLDWLFHAHAPSARERRRQLVRTVEEMLALRHQHGRDWPLTDPEIHAFRDSAQAQARLYLGQQWMHTPWLTAYALANLLASELSLYMAKDDRDRPAVAVLRDLWAEILSGRYDGPTATSRLHGLEPSGIYVHSLTHALLRLPSG